ncbi:MAG: response regulator transcription factor [Spirochaetes bacterium]|nr:response regulator transcription factor [Spirochaetota bacterium]
MATVLIADDEPKIVRLVAGYLEREGHRTLHAATGRQAVELFRAHHPDLAVLDVMMPDLDGIEAARAMLREADLPIIFLTARAGEADRVAGLELGADDYVVKPFSPRELAARVRSVLRRTRRGISGARPPVDGPVRIEIGGLAVEPVKRAVRVDGAPRALTAVQFDLLAALAREPGRVFTREQLLEAIHEDASEGYERTIDAHVKNLRRALGDRSVRPRFIATVRGVGYKLLEPEAGP